MPKIPKDCKWKSTGRTLGSGGQGDVELVVTRDGGDERVYALKKLRNTISSQARQRFAKEIAALQSIDSPVIARVVDFADTDDDFQYYVMEYFEGADSLSKIIYSDSNPLHGNALESLGLVDRVAEGVAVYESKSPRIVHRDIKPDNILLLPDGSVRLIDFGICQVDKSGVLTLVDENIGARNFGAPECEAGNDAAIDIRADLYSVGKVLWSVMTSKRAFARETPAFSNRSFRAEFPTQPETWHLASVLAGTIRREPANRFRNTADLRKSLQEARRMIEGHFPPLESVAAQCPSCGHTTIRRYDKSHIVFANPNPSGLIGVECSTCGFVFLRNMDTLKETANAREALE